ncbi:MAG: RluA family pseudouridine synthase [Planctomycetota bacterium]
MSNSDPKASALTARILYEAGGLLVIDKPPGLPTSGRTLEDADSLQYELMQHFGGMVWAVHQLDADTSGINVFVREKRLVPHWQRRMRYPNGTKTYLAIVHGVVEFEQRRVDAAIGVVTDEPTRQLGLVADGKRAVSEVRVLARGANASLLEVRIETGRTHQIRIHLASLGHPLIGEDWYREPKCEVHPRQALHAWRLEFADEEEPRRLECPLPHDIVELMTSLGLELG